MGLLQYKTRFLTAIAAVALISGCATGEMGRGETTAVGAGAGAAVGAGVGAVMGDGSRGNRRVAGIGDVAGGVGGFIWSGIEKDGEDSVASDLGVGVTGRPDGAVRVNLPGRVSFAVGKANVSTLL